jgi:hypothetical protein
MARVRHTTKAMEGEGFPSNREDQPAAAEVAEAATTSSSVRPARSLVRFLT